ncbi:hypothetical protein BKA82DRAFT_1003918, partial [Pisolithus tinctorius]
ILNDYSSAPVTTSSLTKPATGVLVTQPTTTVPPIVPCPDYFISLFPSPPSVASASLPLSSSTAKTDGSIFCNQGKTM